MPYYEYRHPETGETFLRTERGDSIDVNGVACKRVWGFQMAKVHHAQFDHQAGRVISDPKQRRQAFKELSEKQSERTNLHHNYVEADWSDTAALRVTDEGLDSTYNRRKSEGAEVKPWL